MACGNVSSPLMGHHMNRFCLVLCTAFVIIVGAGTMSGLGQTYPGTPHPPMGVPMLSGFASLPPMGFGSPVPGPWFSPLLPDSGAGGPEPQPPSEGCAEMIARKAAMRADLKARLSLDLQQLAVWHEVESVAADVEKEERGFCVSLASTADRQPLVERLDVAEKLLSLRLAQLRKVNEPLRKLTAMLTPEQRGVLE
jgi:hypothetical protein